MDGSGWMMDGDQMDGLERLVNGSNTYFLAVFGLKTLGKLTSSDDGLSGIPSCVDDHNKITLHVI
jgi:hypothetical protein